MDHNPFGTNPDLHDQFNIAAKNRFAALRLVNHEADDIESYSMLVESIQSISQELLKPVPRSKACSPADSIVF